MTAPYHSPRFVNLGGSPVVALVKKARQAIEGRHRHFEIVPQAPVRLAHQPAELLGTDAARGAQDAGVLAQDMARAAVEGRRQRGPRVFVRHVAQGADAEQLRGASAFHFVVQGSAPPEAIIPAARRVVAELRPDVPPRFRTIETVVSQSVADRRFVLLLVGVFATAAMLLATLGVYSVIAYVVTQRRQEIGVRVALGAQSADVLRMVLRQGFMLAFIGIAVGTVAALLVGRLLSRFLFGIAPTDPVAFGGVILVLAVVALLASFIPALRAARVDPMTALRNG